MPEKIKSGWLTKRGHFVKNWKKRYVVLTRGSLAYYTDSILSNKKGEFTFPVSDSKLPDISISDFPDTSSKSYRFALRNTVSGAYLELCASGREEKKQWVQKLLGLILGEVDGGDIGCNKKEKRPPATLTTASTAETIAPLNVATFSTRIEEERTKSSLAKDVYPDIFGDNEDEVKKLKMLSEARSYFLASDSDEEASPQSTSQLQPSPLYTSRQQRIVDSDDDTEDEDEDEDRLRHAARSVNCMGEKEKSCHPVESGGECPGVDSDSSEWDDDCDYDRERLGLSGSVTAAAPPPPPPPVASRCSSVSSVEAKRPLQSDIILPDLDELMRQS